MNNQDIQDLSIPLGIDAYDDIDGKLPLVVIPKLPINNPFRELADVMAQRIQVILDSPEWQAFRQWTLDES